MSCTTTLNGKTYSKAEFMAKLMDGSLDAYINPPKKGKQRGYQKQIKKVSGPIGDVFRKVVERNKLTYERMGKVKEYQEAANQISEMGLDHAYDVVMQDNPEFEGVENSYARANVIRQILMATYADMLVKAQDEGNQKEAESYFSKVDNLQAKNAVQGTKMGQANAMLDTRFMDPVSWGSYINFATEKENKKERKNWTKEKNAEVDENASDVRAEAESVQERAQEVAEQVATSEKVKKATKAKPKIAEVDEKIKSLLDELTDAMKEGGFTVNMGVNVTKAKTLPKVAKIITKLAIAYVEKGVLKYSEWQSNMRQGLKKIGISATNDELLDLWNESGANEKARLSDSLAGEDGEKLAVDVIRRHWKNPDGKSLKEKLIKAGFNENAATQIEKAALEEFKAKWQKKAIKPFEAKTPVQRTKRMMYDRIDEAVQSGAIDVEAMRQKFLASMGLNAQLTPAQIRQIAPYVTQMRNNQPGTPLYNKAAMGYANTLYGFYPGRTWKQQLTRLASLWNDLIYASILSGVTTHIKNLLGSATNILLGKTIQPLFNVSKWARAAGKGIKEKSLKSAFDYSPLVELYAKWAYSGAKAGWWNLKDIITHGTGASPKEVEKALKAGTRFDMGLESNKGRAFVGKWNPYNMAKYVGRGLIGEDAFMFQGSLNMHLANALLEYHLNQGLRGKALWQAVKEDMQRVLPNRGQILQNAMTSIQDYEQSTGEKLTETQKKIIVEDMLTREVMSKLDEENVKDLARGSIFTDQRQGIFGSLAQLLGMVSSEDLKVLGKNRKNILSPVLKPFIPFTRIVGNVADFLLDTMPFYGIARAHGISPTNLLAYAMDSRRDDGSLASAKLGPIGSQKYYEQVGRSWMGTISFLMLSSLLMGTDDDDEVQVTGSQGTASTPPNTLRIGTFNLNYTNIPILAIPLSWIGNYNDGLKGAKNPETFSKEFADRNGKAMLQAMLIIQDMSFVSAVNQLFSDYSQFVRESEAGYEEGKKSNQAVAMAKSLTEKWARFALAPLPQNWNAVNQLEKLFSPEARTKKDFKEFLYTLGGLQYLNGKRIGIFGETVKSYPGSDIVDFGTVVRNSENPEYKILSKYGIDPRKIQLKSDLVNWQGDMVELTPEQQERYAVNSGKYFAEYLRKADAGEIPIRLAEVEYHVMKDAKDNPRTWDDSINSYTKVIKLNKLYEDSPAAGRAVIKELRTMANKRAIAEILKK